LQNSLEQGEAGIQESWLEFLNRGKQGVKIGLRETCHRSSREQCIHHVRAQSGPKVHGRDMNTYVARLEIEPLAYRARITQHNAVLDWHKLATSRRTRTHHDVGQP